MQHGWNFLGPSSTSLKPYGSASLWFTHINRVSVERKNSYRSAAAIPTPRSNAPLKLSAACPPAGRSLRTWQGLGARTSATELAAKPRCRRWGKWSPFQLVCQCWSHAHVRARPQHNTDRTCGRGREFSFSQKKEGLPCTWGGETCGRIVL
eukprot:scaffold6837_cov61-Phaeocystis_antarctica.AAC.1